MVLLLTVSSATAADKTPRILVNRPMIVAFFSPNSNAADADADEARADFQLYAKQVHDPLSKRGIELREVYAIGFTVVNGKSVTSFRPTKAQVGYYLIAPGHKPRVEYGVMTDSDLLQIADKYFGTRSP